MPSDSKISCRLLAIRFSALGDVAMTLPALYSLARRYPDLHIDFVTTPFFKRLFINPPANLHVHGLDVKKDYRGLGGLVRLVKALSAFRPDMVADLHNVGRTWIIDQWFRLTGIRVAMLDKMRRARRRVLRKGEAQPAFTGRYADVFARLGFPITLDFETLFPDGVPEAGTEIQHPAVGIAPFARYYNKTYPADLMRTVVEILTRRGVNVYLFGGRGREAELLGTWTAYNDRCHSLAGRFTLEEEIALMARLDVMVSMDSANQHMAALTGTPVVSIWGSTTPACGFMAYRQDSANALAAGLECQPCTIAGSAECPRHTLDCFRELSPERVAEAVMRLLPDAKPEA